VLNDLPSLNTLLWRLHRILADHHEAVTYCLPISDDGGSSAEILRHLGGPSIGDLRSRLLRLAQSETEEQQAVLALLQFRLHRDDADAARREWLDVLEVCQHSLGLMMHLSS